MNRSIACIAFKNDKILIAHRNSSGQMCNRWEFPGGKVEEGETDSQAIIREMNVKLSKLIFNWIGCNFYEQVVKGEYNGYTDE